MKCSICGKEQTRFDELVKSMGVDVEILKAKILVKWGMVATTEFCVSLIAFVGGDLGGEKEQIE